MKILITGASGFTGKWMLHYIQRFASQKTEISGLVNSNIQKCFNKTDINFIQGDLLKLDQIESCIELIRPDMIIHLAGRNHGTLSNLFETNVVGTKNLFDTVLAKTPECKILVVSSSAVYGNAGYNPITEERSLMPLSEYGISKTIQELLSSMYIKVHGAKIAVVRPFNLVGPGQSSKFVCGRIISQVILIHQGKRKYIDIAEIISRRDFIDVRDAVAGYWSILSHPKFEQICVGKSFNIGTGKAYKISQVIEYLEEITGKNYSIRLSDSTPRIQIPTQQADISLIKELTNWAPKLSLIDSLRDMLRETELIV